MNHRSYANIDLSALRHNFRTVKSLVSPGTKILAVIKADGYGHGALKAAEAFGACDYYGVACLNEALELREKGITKPILILGYTAPEEAETLAKHGLTQCVFSGDYLLQLQENLPVEAKLTVHIKIDTGMSRLGFYAHSESAADNTADEILNITKQTKNIEYEGIFTHFTSSECDRVATARQFALFCRVTGKLEEKGLKFPLKHCANSAATVLYPEFHLDMVRPGIVLYGYAPGPEVKADLKPALELKAVIAQVHRVKAGDTVSYNQTYTAKKETEIATVCIGYGDGFSRHLSNGGPVLYRGQKTRILGRICMDQCIIDVTGMGAKPGEEVTLFGRGLSADETAEYSGTISYEVLCNIGKRIPRIYTEET